MKTSLYTLLLATLLSVPGFAQSDTKETGGASQAMAAAQMMEMWTKLNAKGEPHAEFQESVGTWKTVEKHFIGPEPMIGEGTATFRTILDGRYLVQDYKSKSPMGEFEGMGITAYDNLKKQYVSVWMDSMSTGVATSHGQKKGKTLTYEGKQDMPGMGTVAQRMILKEIGPDEILFTMMSRVAGQEEFEKQMEITLSEITYSRVK